MSYSGVAACYDEGFHLGSDYAEADLRNWGPVDGIAQDLIADAVEAREDASRSWRAFKLGIARGYRWRINREAYIYAMKTKENA